MGIRAVASFTRPANTTAYAAEDAVADSDSAPTYLTFKSLGAVGEHPSGINRILRGKIMTDQATNVTPFRLHLFREPPTTIPLDNAAMTQPLWAEREKYIGAVDFAAMNAEGTGATAAYAESISPPLDFVQQQITQASQGGGHADRNVYGLLEALIAFTPASGQLFHIELTVVGEPTS